MSAMGKDSSKCCTGEGAELNKQTEPPQRDLPGLQPSLSKDDKFSTEIVTRKREIQRNFRARQKDRSSAARNLLADTQERLKQAEAEKSSLEARNRVLESFIYAHSRPAAGLPLTITSPQSEANMRWQKADHIPDVVKSLLLPSVQLTGPGGGVLHLTPEDIAAMSIPSFARLYSGEVDQLRAKLREHASTSGSREALVTSTVEATSMILSRAMCNPPSMRSMICSSMADGLKAKKLSREENFSILSLVGYTESQLEDLLAVRSLFVAQVGRLLAERNSLLDRMSKHSHNLTNVQAWAERLQQNIAEEHEMYIQAVTAQYLGISTATQTAVLMVASYPLLMNYTIIEELAASRGIPAMYDAFQPGVAPQVLTWNHVKTYIACIDASNMMTGIPFMGTISKRFLCSRQ